MDFLHWGLPRRISALVLLGAAGLLGSAGCQEQLFSFGAAADQGRGVAGAFAPCITPNDHEALVKQMVDAINAERARHRLRPLKVNVTLAKIADFYSCRMIDGDFFDHVDPYDGSTVVARARDFDYDFDKIGENLAAGQLSVDHALAALMDSPRHRANILGEEYTEIGIAVKDGGRFGRYWVQEFGRRASQFEEPGASVAAVPAAAPDADSANTLAKPAAPSTQPNASSAP